MRWLLLLMFLVACGTTEPQGFMVGLSLSVVAGDGQADTVGKVLPTQLTVALTDAESRPVPNTLVNFVPTDADCGRAFVPSTFTNTGGQAFNDWELGTVAKDCTMEVRAVGDDGSRLTHAEFTATAMPGPMVSWWPGGMTFIGGSDHKLDFNRSAWTKLLDEHGNYVYWRVEIPPEMSEAATVLSVDETEDASRVVVGLEVDSTWTGLLNVIYGGKVWCQPTLSVSTTAVSVGPPSAPCPAPSQ